MDEEQGENLIEPCLHSPKRIRLSIPRASLSHRKCQFCSKTNNLKTISDGVRMNTFIDRGVLIPSGSRCCERHIIDDKVDASLLDDFSPTSDFTNFNRSEITSMLISLREKCSESTVGLDFENPQSLSDETFYNFTGMT